MDYYKISITFSPFEAWFSDVLMAQLAETGFESFVEMESRLEAFIPQKAFDELQFQALIDSQSPEIQIQWDKELIESQNWNEVWEKNYFKPLLIENECVVRAPFHTEFPRAKYQIVIEPNMAFGTGNHETTSMMLTAILTENLTGKKVLDMGCGTGILGILASMKGAEIITAIDIDEWSFNSTKDNAALNGIQNIEVMQGDASLLGNDTYDFIFANIHKNVLMEDLPVYAKCLNINGRLFMSGFYLDDLPDIIAKAGESGLRAAGHQEKNRWVAAAFQN
jgi:ribosomal protein L11 methyltransferase